VFPISGTDNERVLYRTFDLMLVPARGQELLLPDETEARRIVRVRHRARLPVKAGEWLRGPSRMAGQPMAHNLGHEIKIAAHESAWSVRASRRFAHLSLFAGGARPSYWFPTDGMVCLAIDRHPREQLKSPTALTTGLSDLSHC
jgi:hypothetical protein